ncbi:hypothetical protein PSN45_001031 [Yamadazyma tenuis]|uniref:Choline monooxygenase, chloroplastic n=1 Tax=Candida tenuis (strain ATCC 10573 / BCRC 21748 / CBS 615 / JCM 9827 / NBRC 10315 / NRRL Y-1498 / VKM Y-70) TaxID=590646 RepID=G3B7S0_CANTC|nr:ISP domain-containing protein [Yamadazyma tenuis ATCC 10573]EGV62306.1 ISP domain-containing protein [Yamadazyma tenuis ATCC 10573]WEJ93564.1 hypothetical protein PSN45_001031 [Yamadazyma tenuis]
MASTKVDIARQVPSAPPADEPAARLLPGEHTLPASWWTSEKVFELEKRSIFNKSWLFCIHSSRFNKAGDYFRFTFAGINFFVIKSKVDNQIKAFHNVCRHRAYPVVRKDKGSSTVLGCKYHGWSYNSDGKLLKAPHFNDVEGFVKEENSLFPVNTHVTEQGLVFVNFNNDPESVIPFDKWFEGLNSELNEFDFSDYEYHMSYELDGQFNWKTLMDGYQECYHCPTAHPGLSSAFKMETYKVVPKNRYCRHYAQIVREEQPESEPEPEPEQSSWFGMRKQAQPQPSPQKKPKKANPGGEFNGLWVYLFPTNGINCYSPAWYSIRVLPVSPTHTILQYDIFTKKGLDEDTKKEFVDFLQLVELEDFNLCQLTQKNLNEGVYSSGYLHPLKERGVLFYQNLVRDMVKEHFALEQAAGKPINPAIISNKKANKDVQELEEICNQLECGSSSGSSELQW